MKETPGARLIKAAKEAKAIAKGDAFPASVYVPPAKAGRPSSGKIVVSLRLDPDVIAAFRATGPGWQARINEALKAALTRS